MKKTALYLFMILLSFAASAQRGDGELNRDSVPGWQYVTNPPKANAVYKPYKGFYGTSPYSVWQQQAVDKLYSWIQQSYLPRGLIIRRINKNDDRSYLPDLGPLHSYGFELMGFSARFDNGKINLNGEQGSKMIAGFNDFPGVYVEGFNPDGLYFFSEKAPFCAGEDDATLKSEGIDKKIQPSFYNYRTYLHHYHNNGKGYNKIDVVVPRNGEWPFKPVLVKDAVAYIQQQMAAYPAIMKKYPHYEKEIQAALERLKPFYNEVTKLDPRINYRNAPGDGTGHYLLDPRHIVNGKPVNRTFPEHNILVSATQQTIDQTKTDKPLWLYVNLTPKIDFVGSLANYDVAFGTDAQHLVHSMLQNFNFDYASNWLADAEKMKAIAYKPVKDPAKSSGNNIVSAASKSAKASAKGKDPSTILYEDFEGYNTGTFSAKGWHRYGRNGHEFENATLSMLNGQKGKWISIPKEFTFYPDFAKPLPANFTVSYDVYFGKNIRNHRSLMYIRLGTENYINIHDINRNGFDFSFALGGEVETSVQFMKKKIPEKIQRFRIENLKAEDVAHVTITINGAAVAVAVNGKEVFKNETVLPAGFMYTKIGWYFRDPDAYLGNIDIRNNTPYQTNSIQEPKFAGVVKDKKTATPDAGTFETSDYTFKPLAKLDKLLPIAYPVGFKSALPAAPQNSNKTVTTLPAFKAPDRSALLNTLSNAVPASSAFQKHIDDLKKLVVAKLNAENSTKVDNYLKLNKVSSSVAINNHAIATWTAGKPTLALYLFCKAVQADHSDMNAANNLASLLNAYGYAEKAIPVLLYINSKTDNAPAVLANMATAYYNLGDMNNASAFATKCMDKDSLNANGNKVAAFVHLDKAAQTDNKAEAEKAIGCLKRSLKSQYDQEASDLLGKIESNHRKETDYSNTNFNEFPMLKRLELPAMPEDLAQIQSFNKVLNKERSAISKTMEDIRVARKKLPELSAQQRTNNIAKNAGPALIKAGMIITNGGLQYNKQKSDLEEIYKLNLETLTTEHNKKANAILKKYTDQLNQLEGGEGKVDEEIEIEHLKKAQCSEFNQAQSNYLSNVAQLTNKFAQQSEYVSRSYWRDYANWQPMITSDNSMAPFLQAQIGYLTDVHKIISFIPVIEPCIYPSQPTKDDKAPIKPKQWEEEYCANFKGSYGLGAAKIGFNCNSMSISGGEGFVGELNLNYNEDGIFKDITLGAGVGVEARIGNQNIASLTLGVSAMNYVTIGNGPDGVQVTDWGITAGASAGANVGAVGGEVNMASATLSAAEGIRSSGAVPDALRLFK